MMRNQKGEVVTGVMVVMMVIMMVFGGMLMHGNHQHDEKSRKDERTHDHQHSEATEGMHHMHSNAGEHGGDKEGSE